MYKYLLFASLCALGNCSPTIVENGGGYGGFGGGGGGGWQGALSLNGDGGGYGGGGGGYEGGVSSYGTIERGGGDGGESGGSGTTGGDFHHGVSIVGLGGSGHKGKVFDLTEHGGAGHQGSYGGSFVASSKYSAAGNNGGGGFGTYGDSEGRGGFAEHYSDVLGASEQGVPGGLGTHAGYESLSSAGSFGSEGLSSYSSGGSDLGGGYH